MVYATIKYFFPNSINMCLQFILSYCRECHILTFNIFFFLLVIKYLLVIFITTLYRYICYCFIFILLFPYIVFFIKTLLFSFCKQKDNQKKLLTKRKKNNKKERGLSLSLQILNNFYIVKTFFQYI